MLYTKTDSVKYKSEFKTRFTNFAQKAPILISFVTDDSGVTVVHENSGKKHHFEWDFTVPVKSYIHAIKQSLSDNHYPRIVKTEWETVYYTPEEQADMLANGTSPEEIPCFKTVSTSELFRIDKVITLDDVLILQSEKDFKMYRYKLNYSCIYFLKKYRQGGFASLEEAGDFFFKRAICLNELNNSY